MREDIRKAEIVDIVPATYVKDSTSGKVHTLGNFVLVRDEWGVSYHFINGSLNGIPDAKIGTHGIIVYHEGMATGMWVFKRFNGRLRRT